MSGTKEENSSLIQITHSTKRGQSLASLNSCWRSIGTWGDRTCEKLTDCQICSRCSVYSSAQSVLLSRELNGYEEASEIILPAEKSDSSLHLCIKVSDELWALPLECLARVAPRQKIHTVPHTRNILGLTVVDGQLLPVVDLEKLFLGTSTKEENDPWMIIFSLDGGPVAGPVTSIIGIISIKTHSIKELPEKCRTGHTLIPLGITSLPEALRKVDRDQNFDVSVADSVTIYEQISRSLMG